MRMACDHYTPVSDKLIPTGEIAPVGGTVFDLRFPTRYSTRGSLDDYKNNIFKSKHLVFDLYSQISS